MIIHYVKNSFDKQSAVLLACLPRQKSLRFVGNNLFSLQCLFSIELSRTIKLQMLEI